MSLQFSNIQLPAPAKLNLMLHVTGRRDDGYHNLQTLFHFLDLGDDLTLTSRTDGKIVLLPCSQLDIEDSQNLIFRAAKLLQDESGAGLGATITTNKRIPIGGGMGGGSSDAATTLVGLNHIWRTNFSRARLQSLGRSLGADVPIFVFGHSAWGEGIGDKFIAVNVPERWYLVITPPCRVLTADVFAHDDLVRNTPEISLEKALAQGSGNDCEALVAKMYPDVNKCLHWLNNFAKAQMTGTGSSVFAAFPSQAEAREVLVKLPQGLTGFVSRGLNVSPLYQTGKVALA